MSLLWLVVKREVTERLRSKMYRIGIAVTAVLAIVAVAVPSNGGAKSSAVTLEYSDSIPETTIAALQQVAQTAGATIVLEGPETEQAARQKIIDGSIDGFIATPTKILVAETINGTSANNPALFGLMRTVLSDEETYKNSDVSEQQASILRKGTSVSFDAVVEQNSLSENDASSAMAAMIMAFVFLTLLGAFVLNGVIEEKTNRVSEILLSTLKPETLLTGRIVGVAIVGSLQGLVIIAVAFSAGSVSGGQGMSLSLTDIGALVLWLGLGFGMYSWAYAAAGALVSRSEDAPAVVFPLQIPIVVSYGLGFADLSGASTPFTDFLAVFPLTAPMIMLERTIAGTAQLQDVIAAIVLCVLTGVLIKSLAIRIFTGGIMRSGQKVRLKEALKRL